MQFSENEILNGFFGGHEAVVRPDPIPNSDVKRSIADGSVGRAHARVGCRQIYFQAELKGSAFFNDQRVVYYVTTS